MSFQLFEGVVVPTRQGAIPGSVAMMLHLKVEHQWSKTDGRPLLSSAHLQARARACRELMEQGLFPTFLRSLGLELGETSDPHSLAALIRHLESYLQAVHQSSYVETPDELWTRFQKPIDESTVWTDRDPEVDGAIVLGLDQMQPIYLQAVSQLTQFKFRFELALGKDKEARQQPYLIKDILDPIEGYLADANHVEIETPSAWGSNPWGKNLVDLFEGPLNLEAEGRLHLQRGKVASPFAALRAAVDEIVYWVHLHEPIEDRVPSSAITVVHANPTEVAPLLESMLNAEGITLRSVKGRPLIYAPEWSALLTMLEGLAENDPIHVAHGLSSTLEPNETTEVDRQKHLHNLIRKLQDHDEMADLNESFLEKILLTHDADLKTLWMRLIDLKNSPPMPLGTDHPDDSSTWSRRIRELILALDLIHHRGRYFTTQGLLDEAWHGLTEPVSFEYMLSALKLFLETALSDSIVQGKKGIQLITPSAILRHWQGSEVTLILDLEDGVWPSNAAPNPFLDWDRKFLINQALRKHYRDTQNPLYLVQTFWLPRTEEQETMPRAYQRDAFGFNKVLALTRRHLLALYSGRNPAEQKQSSSVFWRSLEGAGDWPAVSRSHLAHRWSGHTQHPLTEQRQTQFFSSESAAPDRIEGSSWVKGLSASDPISPTQLQKLAGCAFRSFSEEMLQLKSPKESNSLTLKGGTYLHRLLNNLHENHPEAEHWTSAQVAALRLKGLDPTSELSMREHFEMLWTKRGSAWMDNDGFNRIQKSNMDFFIRERLYELARFVVWDLGGGLDVPTEEEMARFSLPTDVTWLRQEVQSEVKSEAIQIEIDGKTFWLGGQLDRLEKMVCSDPSQSFYRVLDFKSSAMSSLRSKVKLDSEGPWGTFMQGFVYQLIIQHQESLKTSAALVPLKDFKEQVVSSFFGADEGGLEHQERLKRVIAHLVTEAQSGRYRVTPSDACEYCDFSALCGRPVDLFDALSEDDEDSDDSGETYETS